MQNILSKNHAPFPSIAFTLSSNPSLRRTSAAHDLSVYFRVAYLLTSTSKGSFLRFSKNFERFLWNTTDFVMAGLPRKAASSATDALVQEEETASKAFVPLGEWTITKDVPLSSSRGGRTDWMPQKSANVISLARPIFLNAHVPQLGRKQQSVRNARMKTSRSKGARYSVSFIKVNDTEYLFQPYFLCLEEILRVCDAFFVSRNATYSLHTRGDGTPWQTRSISRRLA